MKVVILAAGTSTRLRPLTDETPKCLLPVAGVPILRRALEALAAVVPELEPVVVTGYLDEKVRREVASWGGTPVKFRLNPDYATTNNSYSLLLAEPEVGGREFILLDGDIIFDAGVVAALLESPQVDCLALRPADDLGDEEIKVELDGERRVRRIGKDIPPARAAGESIGIERFSPALSTSLFETLRERVVVGGRRNEWYEASFQQMIDGGAALHAVDVGDYYCAEIDTAEDLAAVDQALRT